ncbi:conserved hypothetical protein [Culex quinquefasciatus]|uniref:E3 ubiquitin-protein ligase n=1 Tax=Culex quinquefasciatus TaxID=7176 RepID=B0X5S9_CULQU|nr:conserved hypothetical protein [Culex quinquefasciatus]|eukprot:XP_001865001.1 conserved hypothetical protein [Culex quinquefasciatus]
MTASHSFCGKHCSVTAAENETPLYSRGSSHTEEHLAQLLCRAKAGVCLGWFLNNTDSSSGNCSLDRTNRTKNALSVVRSSSVLVVPVNLTARPGPTRRDVTSRTVPPGHVPVREYYGRGSQVLSWSQPTRINLTMKTHQGALELCGCQGPRLVAERHPSKGRAGKRTTRPRWRSSTWNTLASTHGPHCGLKLAQQLQEETISSGLTTVASAKTTDMEYKLRTSKTGEPSAAAVRTGCVNLATRPPNATRDARIVCLMEERELADEFFRNLFSVLYEGYSSSTGPSVRYKCLRVLLRKVYFAYGAFLLRDVFKNQLVSSRISGMMASNDLSIVIGPLQVSEILSRSYRKCSLLAVRPQMSASTIHLESSSAGSRFQQAVPSVPDAPPLFGHFCVQRRAEYSDVPLTVPSGSWATVVASSAVAPSHHDTRYRSLGQLKVEDILKRKVPPKQTTVPRKVPRPQLQQCLADLRPLRHPVRDHLLRHATKRPRWALLQISSKNHFYKNASTVKARRKTKLTATGSKTDEYHDC